MATKTVFINIQIDEIKLSELEDLEDNLKEVLKDFPNRRVDYNVSDGFGTTLPPVSQTKE